MQVPLPEHTRGSVESIPKQTAFELATFTKTMQVIAVVLLDTSSKVTERMNDCPACAAFGVYPTVTLPEDGTTAPLTSDCNRSPDGAVVCPKETFIFLEYIALNSTSQDVSKGIKWVAAMS